MHILIAPNAFKHALDAHAAAKSIEQGLTTSKLSCTCECFPVGDGGNGTGKLIIDRMGGQLVTAQVKDPLGRLISASYGKMGDVAVIEMADASGLHLLASNELDPLRVNSYGTGQLIKAALDERAKGIILCMGGSATVDGGSGILAALGVRFLDQKGEEITDLPLGLERLHRIDRSLVDRRLKACRLVVLCDVQNPLLGPDGAAAVFGPQKGATPEVVERLDVILSRFATIVEAETGESIAHIASGGVAGGASAGLMGVLNAELVSGIDYFLQLTHFQQSLDKSSLVITGEGSLDSQTLQGKAPFGVAKLAKQTNLPVIGLAGRVPMDRVIGLEDYFDMILAIGNGPAEQEIALRTTADNLERVGRQIGNLLAAAGTC